MFTEHVRQLTPKNVIMVECPLIIINLVQWNPLYGRHLVFLTVRLLKFPSHKFAVVTKCKVTDCNIPIIATSGFGLNINLLKLFRIQFRPTLF